jgi:TetR/AcrR family transcriptional regulator, cholesterol catabolism regulator
VTDILPSPAGRREVRALRRTMSSEQRRQQIVDEAALVFDRVGYAHASMEEVAQAVGIAKPTLYHYFSSKDELLFWIHESFIDLLIDRHTQRLTMSLRPDQLLLEVMADILELMETHRGHVRVFFEHHRELPLERQETIRIKRDRYHRMVQEVFESGIEQGIFRRVDSGLATFAMFGMCNWTYQWYRAGGRLRTRDIAVQFNQYLAEGVANRQLPGSGRYTSTADQQ